MRNYYLYVLYPIKKVGDDFIAKVDFNDAESFTRLGKAVAYMKDNYGQFIMAVENSDEEVYQEVRKLGQ